MKRDRLPSAHNQRRLRAEMMKKAEERKAQARAVVATGKCPDCGAPLRHNSAIRGWWQCSQYGAEGFRADSTKPTCPFQTFTE